MVPLPESVSSNFIKENFKKGDILRWENFTGEIETKDRFFVLLTGCIENEFIAVTATSKISLYIDTEGKRRFHEFVFIENGRCHLFNRDTILDLNWIEKFSLSDIVKLLGSGITRKGVMSEEIILEINNMVSQSRVISKIDIGRILGS